MGNLPMHGEILIAAALADLGEAKRAAETMDRARKQPVLNSIAGRGLVYVADSFLAARQPWPVGLAPPRPWCILARLLERMVKPQV